MNEDLRIVGIAEKLKAAKAKDVWPFGAAEHCFRLEPILAEPQLSIFESDWRVRLPPEYRDFITRIGNGGAGPAYGLFPLEEAVTYRGPNVPNDFLSSPFPFVTAYNPYDDPNLSEYWKRSREGQITKQEYEARKFREVTGTLVLCHEGCGYLHLLVVSGPARGYTWLDATVSDGGYVPLGVSFLEWYERWLDSALAGTNGNWWND
jgi:hypothetical protein